MSYLIAIDDGHGIETPGKRTPVLPDGIIIHENQFNSAVCKLFAEEMQRCGCRIIFTAPTDNDTSLGERVRIANNAKANIFISFHYNAFRGIWDETKGGVSTHYYINSANGKRLAELVQAELIKGTPQVNRGINGGNLYVVKYTDMPACLIEAGFMDVMSEAKLMLDVNFQKEVARETAQGVCNYLGIPYVDEVKQEEVKIEQSQPEVKPTPQPEPIVKPATQAKAILKVNQRVLAYQKAFNKMGLGIKLVEDGLLGKNTLASLEKLPLIKLGAYNAMVGFVQGVVGTKQDNRFGNATLSMVKSYQSNHGLQVDGIVGQVTLKYMITH